LLDSIDVTTQAGLRDRADRLAKPDVVSRAPGRSAGAPFSKLAGKALADMGK
jgi:hypothetical protein